MGKSPIMTVTHQPLPACSSSLRLPSHASASAMYPQALSLLLLLPTSLETCCSLRRSLPASMAWGEEQGHSPELLEFRLGLCPFYFCTAVKPDHERRQKQREVQDRWKDPIVHFGDSVVAALLICSALKNGFFFFFASFNFSDPNNCLTFYYCVLIL